MKYVTTTPLISVIIPIYNAEPYISQCLESVLSQTYNNIEIIVINDGSTDQSEQILNLIVESDKRIHVIHKKNEGVSSARNIGIQTARGEYVTFVDADDKLHKDSIATMVSLIETQAADVIRTNYISYRSGIRKIGFIPMTTKLYKGNEILELIEKVIMGDIPGYTWLLLIRKDVLIKNKIIFDSSLSMMEDTKFYVDLFKVCQSIYLSDVITYSYMINTTSASRSIYNYKRNANDIINLNLYFKKNLSSKIFNLSNLDADHAVFLTSQIALAVEYPNRAHNIALDNLVWLSSNKSFTVLCRNGDFSNASIYSQLVIFLIKHKLILVVMGLFVIRGHIRRFI